MLVFDAVIGQEEHKEKVVVFMYIKDKQKSNYAGNFLVTLTERQRFSSVDVKYFQRLTATIET